MSLFKRSIEIEVEETGDSDLLVKGKLKDIREGETLHEIEAEMVVSVFDGKIKDIIGAMPTIPLKECHLGLKSIEQLNGATIKPGFTEMVRQAVGSSAGCTHLASLVVNMGNVSVQGRGAYMRKHFPEYSIENEAVRKVMEIGMRELGLFNSCVCWTEDGPILSRLRKGGKEE